MIVKLSLLLVLFDIVLASSRFKRQLYSSSSSSQQGYPSSNVQFSSAISPLTDRTLGQQYQSSFNSPLNSQTTTPYNGLGSRYNSNYNSNYGSNFGLNFGNGLNAYQPRQTYGSGSYNVPVPSYITGETYGQGYPTRSAYNGVNFSFSSTGHQNHNHFPLIRGHHQYHHHGGNGYQQPSNGYNPTYGQGVTYAPIGTYGQSTTYPGYQQTGLSSYLTPTTQALIQPSLYTVGVAPGHVGYGLAYVNEGQDLYNYHLHKKA